MKTARVSTLTASSLVDGRPCRLLFSGLQLCHAHSEIILRPHSYNDKQQIIHPCGPERHVWA
jgi:hypothetical protein